MTRWETGNTVENRGWMFLQAEKPVKLKSLILMQTVNTEYLELFEALYSDIASVYPATIQTEFARDLETVVSRFWSEGLGFLTKVLPQVGRAIDFALSNGSVLQVPNFSRRRGSKLPSFLGWLIGQVFSAEGLELGSPNPVALMHIRQLLGFLSKLEMPYASHEEERVIAQFVKADEEVGLLPIIREPKTVSIIKGAESILAQVLDGVDPLDINPKHGPGSVATGERKSQKPYFKRDYANLTEVYPLDSHFYYNANHISDRLSPQGLMTLDVDGGLRPWENLSVGTAKVVLVPKDSRGPRLISMEPLEYQWIQQGQCERLVSRFESHWITKGHLNFTDQEINRLLALSSSGFLSGSSESWNLVQSMPACARPKSLDLVTLDMKEASDRVSYQLVSALFPLNWVTALMASRTDATTLPNGIRMQMNKFAPMGSAVCFPVEAACFFALAVSAIMHHRPHLTLAQARARVWVYGDDIICYQEDYLVVEHILTSVGLLLNRHKCCTSGSFRESCGMDAYQGICVTPLRIRKRVDTSLTASSLMAYVSYSNEAFARGYTTLAWLIELSVRDKTTLPIPFSNEEVGGVLWYRPYANARKLNKQHGIRTRFNRDLHFLEAYSFVPRAVIETGYETTYETYFYSMSQRRFSPAEDPQKLADVNPRVELDGSLLPGQYSVPRRVSPKRGWKQISYR